MFYPLTFWQKNWLQTKLNKKASIFGWGPPGGRAPEEYISDYEVFPHGNVT